MANLMQTMTADRDMHSELASLYGWRTNTFKKARKVEARSEHMD